MSAAPPKVKVKVKPQFYPSVTRVAPPGRCVYHQEIPATFICIKCGRAICHGCSIFYGNISFCPQCSPYGPGIKPTYLVRPEISPFVITCFVLAIVAGICLLAGMVLTWVYYRYYGEYLAQTAWAFSGISLAVTIAPELFLVIITAILALTIGIIAPLLRNYPLMLASGILLLIFGILSIILPVEVILRTGVLERGIIDLGFFLTFAGGIIMLICGIIGLIAASQVKKATVQQIPRFQYSYVPTY